MKTDYWMRRAVWLATGSLLSAALVEPAVAEVFTIETNQSSVTLSGSILGYDFSQQGQGSLTATYAGSLEATLGAGTIQFPGESVILAQPSGAWQPLGDGTSGSAPADYGATASAPIGTAIAALRSVQLDVTSPLISVVAGQFAGTSLTYSFPTNASSSLAYNLSGLLRLSGAKPLSGYATNQISTEATLTTNANQRTLTIPVNATFVLSLTSPDDTSLTIVGQLVATSTAMAPPAIQSIKISGTTVTLQWQGAPGQQFQVQASASLTSGWTTVATVSSATGGTYTWSGTTAGPGQFFRLAL